MITRERTRKCLMCNWVCLGNLQNDVCFPENQPQNGFPQQQINPRSHVKDPLMNPTYMYIYICIYNRRIYIMYAMRTSTYSISTLGMVAKNFVFCRPPVKMNRTKKTKKPKNMPRTAIIGMYKGCASWSLPPPWASSVRRPPHGCPASAKQRGCNGPCLYLPFG